MIMVTILRAFTETLHVTSTGINMVTAMMSTPMILESADVHRRNGLLLLKIMNVAEDLMQKMSSGNSRITADPPIRLARNILP